MAKKEKATPKKETPKKAAPKKEAVKKEQKSAQKTSKSKEQQQQRRVEYQYFELRKFKVTSKGVDVTHVEKGGDTGEVSTSGIVVAHPDLKTKMDTLKLYMATRLGLLMGWDYARETLKLKDGDALQLAIDGHQEAVERCNIGGLTFVGEGETYGVQITGSLKTPHNGSIGLAVPKITFGKETLGYEVEVEEICEEIKKEVYAYRFQHKKAQLDIETEIEKDQNPDLFKKV